MKQFVFQIEEDEGTFVAVCHDPEMATQADNLESLIPMIRDLVQCRFEPTDEQLHWPIRLHFEKDPILAAA